MELNTATFHVSDAIASIDPEVAALVAKIEELQDRVDTLGDARIDLVTIRDRLNGSDPAPTPEAQQRSAPDTTPARSSVRSAAIPPAPKPKPAAKPAGRAKSTGGKYDLAEVARVACAAIDEGRSAAKAVVAELGAASPAAASMAISKARKAGHDIPKVRPVGNGKKKKPTEIPTTHHTSDSAVLPFRRPAADVVADLEAQAGLPT